MGLLPEQFRNWFSARGWDIHPHQTALLESLTPAQLLIAPTGGGKTLAGFLPSLIDLAAGEFQGLHTLYVSPLKALAVDIARNLKTPVEDMSLPVRIEDRTGDTSQQLRKRQRVDPPHILLTTPESLALLLSYEDAPKLFGSLKRVIIDEIHALAESKRGDQLMLALSRLQSYAPDLKKVGLSATVEDPPALARFLEPNSEACRIIEADPGPDPDIKMLTIAEPPPWSGAGAVYAAKAVLDEVKKAKTTLIFINTRAQAEIFFHALWQENSDDLPIALHHGSLAKDARLRVEQAMIDGALRAIVCTGTLDLGIDWGDVDLVIQIAAPKNVKRLVQRIGRSNHRYNAPSRALIVPANRFEVIECQAALAAVKEHDLDGEPRGDGPLDVLCQHILITACAGPFDAEQLYSEILTAGPYASLSRIDFDRCLEFCATGGYALRAYDQWQRLISRVPGQWQLRDPRNAQRIRMNIGTIIDTETMAVRLKNSRGGTPLGEVEEAFAASLTQGDTFLIGGKTVRYEGLRELTVEVTRNPSSKPKIAVFSGTKFATSTRLSERVIDLLNSDDWSALPAHTQDWLSIQKRISEFPRKDVMLVESFARHEMHYTCFYGFAGRNAMQTLGLLLTRQMEDRGLAPMGFVPTDYAVLIWGLEPVEAPSELLDAQRFDASLNDWLAENALMKRGFRNVAQIAGLIERRTMGKRKSGRQATFSSDILYDTLRKYDPDHVLLQITRSEAMRGLVDFSRIEDMLARTKGRVRHVAAPHVTPLAAPILLEVGKVPIKGHAEARIMAEEADRLMQEAGLI